MTQRLGSGVALTQLVNLSLRRSRGRLVSLLGRLCLFRLLGRCPRHGFSVVREPLGLRDLRALIWVLSPPLGYQEEGIFERIRLLVLQPQWSLGQVDPL